MRDPMRKRIPRELRRDIGKYIALFAFLTVMIGFISGFIIGDESLKARYDTSFDEFQVEDGHFVLEKEASKEMLKKVSDTGVTVFPLFYKEENIEEAGSSDGSEDAGSAGGSAEGDTVRIFNRGWQEIPHPLQVVG